MEPIPNRLDAETFKTEVILTPLFLLLLACWDFMRGGFCLVEEDLLLFWGMGLNASLLLLLLLLYNVLFGIGEEEPVELLRDSSGRGQKVLAYPLPQFKLELRLIFQNTAAFDELPACCFGPAGFVTGAGGIIAGGGGGGGCVVGAGPILLLISMGRIFPLWKSSSAEEDELSCRSKLWRKTQKSKSMLEVLEDRTYCSTGTNPVWGISWEKDILGLIT